MYETASRRPKPLKTQGETEADAKGKQAIISFTDSVSHMFSPLTEAYTHSGRMILIKKQKTTLIKVGLGPSLVTFKVTQRSKAERSDWSHFEGAGSG